MIIRVTCLGASIDKSFLTRLHKHLLNQRSIEAEFCIAETVSQEGLLVKIQEASILLIMISADFFVEFCENIIDAIKARITSNNGIVIPIYAKYHQIPACHSCIQDLDWLPSKKMAIENYDNEKLWTYINFAISREARSLSIYEEYRPGSIPKITQPLSLNKAEPIYLTSQIISSYKSVSRPQIRRILQKLFPTISSFDAFCLDYFPAVKWLFSNAMNRTDRTNLLLENIDCKQIQKKLEEFLGAESS